MLAKQIGISPNHISVLERGETAPSLDTIHAFATTFGCTMGELLDGEPTGDAWLKKVVATAAAVPSAKRPLLLTLLAAIVVAVTRSGEETPADLAEARSGMDNLLERNASLASDEPRILVIVDLLRKMTPPELDLALKVIRALR